MLKVIVTTGGTGGHIFPALATIETLRKRNARLEILFVGATYGAEAKLVQAASVPFVGLSGRGMLGRGLAAVPAAWDNFRAALAALRIVRDFGPCAVAAFGGYASFPAAVAARLLGVPLLLHEQNAISGTVNRLLGKLARTRCVSLSDTRGLPEPYVVTGNPVRQDITPNDERSQRNTRRLLVLGGSQGAHALNRRMIEILDELKLANVEILHQTGEKDIEWTRQAYAAAGYDPQCAQPFIQDMARAYAWADLAFCRAGASTVAELCIAGLPAILTPFPAAIHDHQTLNARVIANAGAAKLLPEGELSALPNLLLELVANRPLLARMSAGALANAKPRAAELVACEIEKLCRQSSARMDK